MDPSLKNYFLPMLLVGGGVCGLCYLFSEKVRTRIRLFVEPIQSIVEGQEQSVVNQRILSGMEYSGFLGTQFQFESLEMPPSMTTDYVISSILLDMGMLTVLGIFIVYILILLTFHFKTAGMLEMRILRSVICVLGASILISCSANVMAGPISGLSLPYITAVSSAQSNMAFLFITGLACKMRYC